MCYCLRIAEVMGVEDNGGSSNREVSSDESNGSDGSNGNASNVGEASEASDLGVDIEHDVEFSDCRKLVKFNYEQKRRLKEMLESLRAKEDKKEQV